MATARSRPRRVVKCPTTFDFIVIGGGASGAIVVSRLCEANYKVLLLERGNCFSWFNEKIMDPTQWAIVSQEDSVEWGYVTVPQTHLNDRIITTPRAKALGGCQIHNAMVYVRGGREGYDNWETEYGCVGWDYDSIVTYFERAESSVPVLQATETDLFNALVDACAENNIPYNPDYNDPDNGTFGISPFQFLIDASDPSSLKRATAFSSYVQQIHVLANLTVRTDALVSRLLFDGTNKCTGVEFYDMTLGCSDVVYEVSVVNDVILSAGAIGTPQILMLSGIGDSAHLSEFGIPTISNLPGVGQNLQDDLFVAAGFLSKQPVDPDVYGLLGIVIFWPSDLTGSTKKDDTVITDIEASSASGAMIGRDFPPPLQQSYWLYPNIQKLESRGTILLQSDSPLDHPLIDPNYLAEQNDLDRCLSSLKTAIDIGSADAMTDWYLAQIDPPPDSSDDELIEYIRETAGTTHHFAGTARMGTDTDPMAVVSYETLMVYGVTGLRVVDASIIPETVSGNTIGAAMMIGEKASDIILSNMSRKMMKFRSHL